MSITVSPIIEEHQAFQLFDYLKNHLQIDTQESVEEVIVRKNEYVYHTLMKRQSIYEIVEGSVKLGSYSDIGDEFVYDVLYHGDFFGNLQYLNDQFYEFSKTLVDTRIRVYDLSFFKSIVVKEPSIAEWFMAYLVKRWSGAEKKLKKINEKGTSGKISFLKSQFNILVRDVHQKEYVLFDLLTQKDLGDLVGATRQTIASALKKV